MRILFDHNVPRGLGQSLQNHNIEEAKALGWDRLSNGQLLSAAEAAGFDLLLTADQGFSHQQNLDGRDIGVVVLSKGQWPYIKLVVERVVQAVNSAKSAAVVVVDIPIPKKEPRKKR